eukprot:TRINITY_DN10939_c0_g1_i1.p1 TRINITY_DN10939_c0_g1~~TRINITY_DN10939_c0_g1_i1.p1  ORF type:complete len:222 (-),score=22.36 TRINITY_DN10939_c0_g1_i1:331-996(-)
MLKFSSLARSLIGRQCHSRIQQCQKDFLQKAVFRSFSTGETGFPDTTTPGTCVYGRLINIGKHTSKKDILRFFEGCHLRPDDIKFAYNQMNFNPLGLVLQFSSKPNYNHAVRLINIKGRYLRLHEVDRIEWDNSGPSYDGKVLALQGVPKNARVEDVEHCFPGYSIVDIRFVNRGGAIQSNEHAVRFALVRFPTEMDALIAMREKNKTFCLNNSIVMKLLR